MKTARLQVVGSLPGQIARRRQALQYLAALFVALLVIGLAYGQGTLTSGGRRWSAVQTYDPKTSPPLALPVAYQLAVYRIGEATNRFHCVSASCLVMTNNGFTGWTFYFANTNAQQARVDVFFDKEVYMGLQSEELLRAK